MMVNEHHNGGASIRFASVGVGADRSTTATVNLLCVDGDPFIVPRISDVSRADGRWWILMDADGC